MGAITYAISLFSGSHSIPYQASVALGGSITTDGSTGLITDTHIVDWDLIAAVGVFEDGGSSYSIFNLTGPLSGGNSSLSMAGDVLASATDLTSSGDLTFSSNSNRNEIKLSEISIGLHLISILQLIIVGVVARPETASRIISGTTTFSSLAFAVACSRTAG